MSFKYEVKGYSFIKNPMHALFKKNANDYIQKNINKTIFKFQSNLYDIKSLSRLVNLDCLNCRSAHTRLCCNGSPYTPNSEDINIVRTNLSNIIHTVESYNEDNNIAKVIEDKGFLNDKGTFIDNCGRCVFSVKIPGADVCGIHAYALENDMKYTSLKPKSCLMYPLDMIELKNGQHFIFGITEGTVIEVEETKNGNLNLKKDNQGFSRWNITDLDFVCVNKKHRENILETKKTKSKVIRGTLPKTMFKVEDYKPIYEEEKNVLIELFGEDAYQFINMKANDMLIS